MIHWIRFVAVALAARFKPRLSVLDTSEIALRIGFFDADLRNANNASILRLTEFGRLDLMVRTGLLGLVMRKRWSVPLASAHVAFLRPLRRWQKIRISSRVVHWQDEWIYVENVIRSGEKIHARAIVRSTILTPQGKAGLNEVLPQLGLESRREPPAVPPELDAYIKLDASLRRAAP